MGFISLLTSLALLIVLATPALCSEPQVFTPATLETEFGTVGASRRVAVSASDKRLAAMEAAAKCELQFAVRLRPFMRRAIALDPADVSHLAPLEYSLAAGTTLSERRGRAPSYRRGGHRMCLALSKSGPQPELISFAQDGEGYRVLSRLALGASGQEAAGLLLLDLTGSGLLSIVVPLSAIEGARAGVAIAEVAGDGKLQLLTPRPLPAREAALSLVDIDADGLWEIETQLELSDLQTSAVPGPFLANQLYRWDARRRVFADVTSRFVWRYRPERRFYQHFMNDGAWQFSADLTNYLSQSWDIERIPK